MEYKFMNRKSVKYFFSVVTGGRQKHVCSINIGGTFYVEAGLPEWQSVPSVTTCCFVLCYQQVIDN
jgi:hypothetical protein